MYLETSKKFIKGSSSRDSIIINDCEYDTIFIVISF